MEDLKKRILKASICPMNGYPWDQEHVSEQTKDLIKKLLVKDPK
jgi:hypothetical protein